MMNKTNITKTLTKNELQLEVTKLLHELIPATEKRLIEAVVSVMTTTELEGFYNGIVQLRKEGDDKCE